MIVFLDTQSWTRRLLANDDDGDYADDTSLQEVKNALEALSTHFRDPLEAVEANLPLLHDEIVDVVVYARTYLEIERTDYRKKLVQSACMS